MRKDENTVKKIVKTGGLQPEDHCHTEQEALIDTQPSRGGARNCGNQRCRTVRGKIGANNWRKGFTGQTGGRRFKMGERKEG